jgi:hypothetical protein
MVGLPNEILVKIFSYATICSPICSWKWAMVCKDWLQIWKSEYFKSNVLSFIEYPDHKTVIENFNLASNEYDILKCKYINIKYFELQSTFVERDELYLSNVVILVNRENMSLDLFKWYLRLLNMNQIAKTVLLYSHVNHIVDLFERCIRKLEYNYHISGADSYLFILKRFVKKRIMEPINEAIFILVSTTVLPPKLLLKCIIERILKLINTGKYNEHCDLALKFVFENPIKEMDESSGFITIMNHASKINMLHPHVIQRLNSFSGHDLSTCIHNIITTDVSLNMTAFHDKIASLLLKSTRKNSEIEKFLSFMGSTDKQSETVHCIFRWIKSNVENENNIPKCKAMIPLLVQIGKPYIYECMDELKRFLLKCERKTVLHREIYMFMKYIEVVVKKIDMEKKISNDDFQSEIQLYYSLQLSQKNEGSYKSVY